MYLALTGSQSEDHGQIRIQNFRSRTVYFTSDSLISVSTELQCSSICLGGHFKVCWDQDSILSSTVSTAQGWHQNLHDDDGTHASSYHMGVGETPSVFPLISPNCRLIMASLIIEYDNRHDLYCLGDARGTSLRQFTSASLGFVR